MLLLTSLLALAASTQAAAPDPPIAELGPNLERFAYPWPVQTIRVPVGQFAADMAYMDVAPTARANGRTVVLLHGKNFCGATWERTARMLAGRGYRVLIPDQIGFCKSAKPAGAQYSLRMLAANTAALMQARGIERAAIVGHSMGGMLAMRFAIQHPERTERLVLVNPLGLADRLAQGVPYTPLDRLLAGERRTSYQSIRAYQTENYYSGAWTAEYDRWARMLAGQYAGGGNETVALAQAKTSDMIQTQPVVYELGRIAVPTTLLIGTRDRTVFGKANAPEEVRATLKPIPEVAANAAARIKGARLVRIEGAGHSPQVEVPERFERLLVEALE
ncbi:alpha/beta fold hydrolase [Sphingomonas qomolangmaensis]|uniref:Alpha/beta hydrolase n=1 Tax=Sphingomonas qomolangmaensis TaxID=2918765 RepID=A0ABY5L7Y0_9SPHN|nr:alpha/beta hydrolase [Sphingomonas qomolangmaensis]UUL82902.1 alpha/beta hydrolase [Sphingomonas qomolangmaensis]